MRCSANWCAACQRNDGPRGIRRAVPCSSPSPPNRSACCRSWSTGSAAGSAARRRGRCRSGPGGRPRAGNGTRLARGRGGRAAWSYGVGRPSGAPGPISLTAVGSVRSHAHPSEEVCNFGSRQAREPSSDPPRRTMRIRHARQADQLITVRCPHDFDQVMRTQAGNGSLARGAG